MLHPEMNPNRYMTNKETPASKAIHSDLAVFAARANLVVAEPNAGDGPCMTRERPFVSLLGIPHFDHPVLGAADDPEPVCCKGPHTFEVSKVGVQASAVARLPQPDRRVQCAGEHISRRQLPLLARES